MADIKRTLAELLVTFQDGQAADSITEQDLRDFIISMASPFGGGGMENNVTETVINTINVFEVIGGTFVANSSLNEITVEAGGLLTYTGTPNRHFFIVSNFDMLCASSNQVLKFQWFKNGVALQIPLERKIGTGTDIGSASCHVDATLSTGDTLQLKITNETSTANITIQNIYLFVAGMFT